MMDFSQYDDSCDQLMFDIINDTISQPPLEIADYWDVTIGYQQYYGEPYTENGGIGTVENNHWNVAFGYQQYYGEPYAENGGIGTVENNHWNVAFGYQQYYGEPYSENGGIGTVENNHWNAAFGYQQYYGEPYTENGGIGTVENNHWNVAFGYQQYYGEPYAENGGIGTVENNQWNAAFGYQQYYGEPYAENGDVGTVENIVTNHVEETPTKAIASNHTENISVGTVENIVTNHVEETPTKAIVSNHTENITPKAIVTDHVENTLPLEPIANNSWKMIEENLQMSGVYSPQAIREYCLLNFFERRRPENTIKVRRHLLSIGWKIERSVYRGSYRFRYTSPDGVYHYSLLKICQQLMGLERSDSSLDGSLQENCAVERKWWELDGCNDAAVEKEHTPVSVIDTCTIGSRKRKLEFNNSDVDTEEASSVKLLQTTKCMDDSPHKLHGVKRKNRRMPSTNLSSLIDSGVILVGQKVRYFHKKDHRIVKEGMVTREGINCLCCENIYTLSKFEDHAGSSNHRPAANIFLEDGRSLMQCQVQLKPDNEVKGFEQDMKKPMDSDLPHPDMKVEGSSTGHLHEEMLNIFLEDGRSLLQCQVQLKPDNEVKDFEQDMKKPMDSDLPHPDMKIEGSSTGHLHEEMLKDLPHHEFQDMEFGNAVNGFTEYPYQHIESNWTTQPNIQQIEGDNKVYGGTGYLHEEMNKNTSCSKNNGICNICHHDGNELELLVCGGGCMSSFHLNCIGLRAFPERVWYCPSCQCGLCGGGEFDDGEIFKEKTILYCDQCEHGYHVGCLRERGDKGLDSCPEGNWFCGENCSKIFDHLQKLLGKPNPTGVDGLSWTILRSNKEDACGIQTSPSELMSKRKLLDARAVLRECFKRIIQPNTKTDLVTDVVFSKESVLPHQNYRGFYTMILDKGKKPISVATFRIHGHKVAELPLVGTRILSRRRGMCRLLMNNLQKLLLDMGVEKLLLPAAPKLLQTWINSFGFVKVSNSDRIEFLGYPFLEFTDTILCQKLLKASTATKSRKNKDGFQDGLHRSRIKVDCHQHSSACTVIQAWVPINKLPSQVVRLHYLISESSNGENITTNPSFSSNYLRTQANKSIWQTREMKRMCHYSS